MGIFDEYEAFMIKYQKMYGEKTVVLYQNGMFYEKNKSSNLITIFYYEIDSDFIYSRKKIDKILIHFGGPLCKM